MKRTLPLMLALLLALSACGAANEPAPSAAETPEVTVTPSPTPIAGTVYSNDELGFTLQIPDVLAQDVAAGFGVPYFNEEGPSVSFYYLPVGQGHGLLFSIAVAPRDALFDADAWYNGIR